MKTLLAGATGYLGEHIAQELLERKIPARLVVRSPGKLTSNIRNQFEILEAELTQPETLTNICEGIDTVISTVGITRQKDDLTYMDVDYQANINLLAEALKSKVKKFVYVSVLNGDKLKYLKICKAKEKFVEALKKSGLDYSIIRPNGFFSDMGEVFEMAKKGRVYLFGNGQFRANPIHGADLAKICVDVIATKVNEIEVGGPQTYTQNEIAKIAFDVLGKNPKIMHIPDWVRKTMLGVLRAFSSSKTYGPVEFFMTVLAMDMIAPEYGSHSLAVHFKELATS